MALTPREFTVGLVFAAEGDRIVLEQHFRRAGYGIAIGGPAVGFSGTADLWIVDEETAIAAGDALLALKRQAAPGLLPVLVAIEGGSSAARWLKAGFDDVLRIPITKDELEARVGVFRRLVEHVDEHRALDAARLDWVIRQIPVGVLIAEAPSGAVLRANEEMARIWRRPIVGTASVEEYGEAKGYHRDGRPYEAHEWPLARTVLTGEVVAEEEIAIERGDGTPGVLLVSSGPVLDRAGRVVAAVATCFDITERRQLLEAEHAARMAAEQANRLKDEFLTTVSHELRTPLNAIVGWMQIIKSQSLDEAGFARAMETIERNVRAQAQIVEDLLDISRIMTGRLHIELRPVDLHPVLRAAVDSLLPVASSRGITLRTTTDTGVGPVMGDPDRLQQVIWNLASNAIKFTPSGGRVEVGLEQTRTHVEITVRDTGQGISPDFVPHVFERFRQADGSTTRKHGGLGLGLAIVREIVAVHDGTVEASSPGLGKGATFTVRLPLAATASLSDARKVDPLADAAVVVDGRAPTLDGVRVLLVEDDEDSCEMLQVVLGHAGATSVACASVEKALEAFSREVPDVIVCDIGLPGADGYDLIRRIRATEGDGPRVPAIALTAYARIEDRVRALREGFHLHLAKPIEPVELVSAIGSLVGRD